jgi:hypothetical protein
LRARRRVWHIGADCPRQEELWQYIHSTPLAEAAAQAGEATRAARERDVCARWREHVVDGFLSLEVGMTTATAVK